ncbi:Acyltransferase family protein [Pedobacter westerhofensis]|uniref:Acyltransferase family protein n=1 Tax=Pedobacter westerhofensis TaxID=425512 RepID=A0A521FLZ5_9SPHI|nr:acyltransferase [Pedobacter westerhofensis]SMO96501.1 Acyltransferase family protein [Pedobacter westerhofensis]
MQGNTAGIRHGSIMAGPDLTAHKSARPNYAFVDWIRMISMLGIIWAHTPAFAAGTSYLMLDNVPLYCFVMDFFKFGVICFFMISGFLLAGKIHTEPPMAYFKRRIYATLIPYLFAFSGIVLLFIFKTYVLHMAGDMNVGQYIVDMFLNSALWFLPSYWLSLIVIMCCRRYLDSKIFGLFLLLVTLGHTWYFAYSANAQSHVHALFAFILYLWLGYYIGRFNLAGYFSKIKISTLLAAFVLVYILSSAESVALWQKGFREPLSILRISNQIYSVLAFITMMRIFDQPLHSNWIKPRSETFGIYLYHMFPLAVLAFLLKFLSKFGVDTFSLLTTTFLSWFIIKFIFVYFTTVILVKVLLRLNIGFLGTNVPQ